MKETAFNKIMGSLATNENTTLEDVNVQCDYWRSQAGADIDEINELESLAIEYINEYIRKRRNEHDNHCKNLC